MNFLLSIKGSDHQLSFLEEKFPAYLVCSFSQRITFLRDHAYMVEIMMNLKLTCSFLEHALNGCRSGFDPPSFTLTYMQTLQMKCLSNVKFIEDK